MNVRRICSLLSLLFSFGLAVIAAAAPPATPPNVVFILADDLGVFDLGCYGRSAHRTPNLDSLATEGSRFSSAYCSQPICSASRASLMTGLSPARLHLTSYLPGRRDTTSQKVLQPDLPPGLPLAHQSLPEVLRDAGYATACIGKWHLGERELGPEFQGFDLHYSGRANTQPSDSEGSKGEFDLTARAMEFITANRDRPFFLYLAHNSPHIPYEPKPGPGLPQPAEGAFEPGYAAVIESLDASVGRLLRHIDSLGLRDSTLFVFTSDNGGLHVPELQHARVTHNGPFRAGKGYLYEGGLRIPLIVRWPGTVPARRVVSDPVLNTDWFATIMEVCHARSPKRAPADSRSFARLLTGRGEVARRNFIWHFPHYTNQGGRPSGAVREGRWKYIEYYDTGARELFDLDRDLGETRSVAASEPARVREFARQLAAHRRLTRARLNTPNPDFDPAAFARLYVEFDPSRFVPTLATPSDWQRVAQWRVDMDQAVQSPSPTRLN